VPQVLCGTDDRATLKHATMKIKYNPTSLSYVVVARWHASRDSIAAYVTVASALAAAGLAGAIVLPGPVKGVRARSIFLLRGACFLVYLSVEFNCCQLPIKQYPVPATRVVNS
jgi:hypothetical protein